MVDASDPHGSCLCGAINFTIHGSPSTRMMCYCLDCRKNSGHLGQALGLLNHDQVEIKDPENNIKEWVITKTSSGSPKRKVFCGRCGSTLMTIPMKHNGEKVVIRSTLLDEGIEHFLPFDKVLFPDEKEKYLGSCPREYL